MKKVLSVIFAVAVILNVFPMQSFAAKDKVNVGGCSISANAKQVCFVGGDSEELADIFKDFFAPEFERYYYVGEDILDFKEIAEKLPKLQNLAVIGCDVENASALTELDDLIWLKLRGNNGCDNLTFLKNMQELKKFSYSSSGCKNIKPVAYLKNLTELTINLNYENLPDLSPIKGLTNLKNLEVVGCFEDLSALSEMKKLNVLKAVSTELSDMSALKKLPKLTELYLEDCESILSEDILPLKNLTVFSMNNVGIDDAGCTAELKKLKSYSLSNVDCEGTDYLDGLPKLEEVYFNNITSPDLTESVMKLKNLKKLTINNCELKNCRFVQKLTNLEELDLSDNEITNITPVSNLKKLRVLYLSSNNIEDLSAVKELKNLNELGLSYNGAISDLTPLKELTELKKLYIYQNSITDISPLKNLTKLEFLNIGSAFSITDTAVKGQRVVLGMPNLKNIIVDNAGFSEDVLKELKKKNPKCKIINNSTE